MLLALAARNLGRNRQRTLATGGAILVGAAALVFADAWVRGIGDAIREYAASARLGSAQVHAQGYFDRADAFPLDRTVPASGPVVDAIAGIDGVVGVAPRVAISGSASNGVDETMILVTGIDPAREAVVCPRFLAGDLRDGRALRDGDVDVALVGTDLARSLSLTVGSSLTLEARDARGRENAVDVEVVGVAASSLPDEAKWLVVLPLPTAQRLAGLEQTATSLVLGAGDPDDVERIADDVRARLASAGAFEVRTWREIGMYFEQAVKTFSFAQSVLVVVLGVLVVLVVVDAAAAAAGERIAEIGTLTAMGAPRAFVRRMLLLEAVVLGLCAGLLGAALGCALAWIAARHGVPFRPPNQPEVLVRPHPALPAALAVVIGAACASALGMALPAWFASRIHPVVALRR